MAKADYCVFVGRFQPIHKAHIKIIENSLKEAGRLIIVVGSHRAPLSLKNPFSFEERKNLIALSIPAEWHDRISIVPLRDFLYSENNWTVGLQNTVNQAIEQDIAKRSEEAKSYYKVKMIGHFKDDSSYYLKSFPQWELIQEQNYFGLNSSDIRNELFGNNRVIEDCSSPAVIKFLKDFQRSGERYGALMQEHQFIKKYRAQWESSPFPPTFVTTDVVVVMSGHVLLVRRGRNPGKGCLALPGGFVKPDKSIFDSALEELKEETSIVYPKEKLKAYLKKEKVFDHPGRDKRGRTITHGFFFQLPVDELPQIKGGDDASEAMWVPLADLSLLEDQFYSDHLHIINHFIYGQ